MKRFLIGTLTIFVFCFHIWAGGSDEKTAGQTSGEGYPMSISHKYGTTTIKAEPKRIVSIGFSEHDQLLALGVMPVAVRDWYGDQPYATWPWAQKALGSHKPTVLSSAELDIEQIASLKPDLIVGVTSGMTSREYEILAKIAPTLAQPGEYVDYGTPWMVVTRILAKATNMVKKGEQLITAIEQRFADIKKNHPDFAGQSAAVAFVYQNLPGAYASQDPRPRLLADLGLVTPKEFDEIAGTSFWFNFSEERLNLLNTKVIVWLAGSDEGVSELQKLPLRESLPSAREGREIFMSALMGGAYSFASPLSIPYFLDYLEPALVAALDGDPATKVPVSP